MTPHFPSDLGDPGRAEGHAEHLTRMSELVRFVQRVFRAKRARLLEMDPVARRVHSFAPVPLIVVGALLLAGCPPPPLSLDEPDAAANSPPGITSVRNETGEEFVIGEENTVILTVSTMTLSLLDPDLDDTLYVRGFFDYGIGTPPHPSARAVCNVGPSTPRAPERSVTCNLAAYCQDGEQGTSHRMDIVVSDREPDDAGDLQPPFYSVDTPGLQATRVYQISCQDPI